MSRSWDLLGGARCVEDIAGPRECLKPSPESDESCEVISKTKCKGRTNHNPLTEGPTCRGKEIS